MKRLRLVGLAAVCFSLSARGAPPKFVESRLDFATDLVDYEVEDVDGDGLKDLLVTTREPAGRRLSLHRQHDDRSFHSEPDWSQVLPPEVIAYGLMDVRTEPGKELLLLTPTGVLSVSFTKPGLAGNARVELRRPVFPELSETQSLPRWPWILDIDFDGDDDLVLPEIGGLRCFKTQKDSSGEMHLEEGGAIPSRFASYEKPGLPRQFDDDDDDKGTRDYDVRALRLFQGAPSTLPKLARPPLLDRRRTWNLPRLGFWNADKLPDAVVVAKDSLSVQLQQADGTFKAPLILPLDPPGKDEDRTFELVDFDSDGQSDLVRITRDRDGTKKEFEVVVLGIQDDGTLKADARAALLFEASDADISFRDVDGDGQKDLVLKTTQLPSGIASLTGIKVDIALEVYTGHPDGSFSKRPDVRFTRTFTPEKLSRLSEAEIFHLSGDYDGDGRDDLLFMDDDGRLEIRRLLVEDGKLSFASESLLPPYSPPAPVLSAWAFDFTKDGASDLCLRFEDSLIMFVSRREAGQ